MCDFDKIESFVALTTRCPDFWAGFEVDRPGKGGVCAWVGFLSGLAWAGGVGASEDGGFSLGDADCFAGAAF